jgi:cyclic beta-1,2-glucan synthetase
MVAHGHPDAGAEDDKWRVASFVGQLEVPAGSERSIVFALGQAGTLAEAHEFARFARDPGHARAALAATKAYWQETLGLLRIETNRPDFDRLVNDWLPYQLLTARLWGRTGPAQRSGAIGYRDQLQDVLPLAILQPETARAQVLLHSAQQFIEGDVLKWWHRAPDGSTGPGDRTRASDPHLWLPYVTLRYITATGDHSILDEVRPFLEGPQVPAQAEGRLIVPTPSRDSATLVDHCKRAIDYTLERLGRNGLPLMGTGDWDDGMNLVGWDGRGESTWLGFFLYDILTGFGALLEQCGDTATATRYEAAALQLRASLDEMWRGDRYLRAITDEGKELAPMSAMTASWPVISGAVTHERGKVTVEEALKVLDKGNRVLLVSPAYTEKSDPNPGRSADYPPGVRENGGQYSHGVSWFVDALAKLANEARDNGNRTEAAALRKRAFEVWSAISPLTKFEPGMVDIYGMPPHQQPADVYDGPGYEGRGGWSWYTGAAARMISSAYAMLGVGMKKGEFFLAPDAFEPRGDLQLKSVTFRGRRYEGSAATLR